VNINVDVTDIDLTSVVGGHQVFDGDDYRTEPVTLGEAVAKEIKDEVIKDEPYRTLRREVLEIRTELVRELLRPLVEEAINAPVQRTNTFGDPQGEPTALREMIMAEVKAVLTRPNRSSSSQRSLVQEIVKSEVTDALRTELTAVIKEERDKVIKAVHTEAATLIADAVKRGLRS
jgi:hypothetical protein